MEIGKYRMKYNFIELANLKNITILIIIFFLPYLRFL